MPAWRILVCLFFVMGFTLAAEASNSAVAHIQIEVAHVPIVQSAVSTDTRALSRDQPACIWSSVHAAPHRLATFDQSQLGATANQNTDFLEPGTAVCLGGVELAQFEAAAHLSQGLVSIRVVPE